MGGIDATLVAIVVALISPLASYLIAARKLSGRIKDSDATELWAESRSIREWSMERVKELDRHIDQLEARIVEVEKRNTQLADENRGLQREIYDLRTTIHDMQSQNAALQDQLRQAHDLVTQLRWEAEHAPRRRASDPAITDSEGEDDDRTT